MASPVALHIGVLQPCFTPSPCFAIVASVASTAQHTLNSGTDAVASVALRSVVRLLSANSTIHSAASCCVSGMVAVEAHRFVVVLPRVGVVGRCESRTRLDNS